jgi:hypothetical protein
VMKADAPQLLAEFEKATADTSQEFAYCSVLFFVRNVGCALHVSSLVGKMWALRFFQELLSDQNYQPLAIIGIPSKSAWLEGKRGRAITSYPQEHWPNVKVYIDKAIEAEEKLLMSQKEMLLLSLEQPKPNPRPAGA